MLQPLYKLPSWWQNVKTSEIHVQDIYMHVLGGEVQYGLCDVVLQPHLTFLSYI